MGILEIKRISIHVVDLITDPVEINTLVLISTIILNTNSTVTATFLGGLHSQLGVQAIIASPFSFVV